MKKLILVRGLPGSGKTTYAKSTGLRHYETDMYFTDPNGAYSFDRAKAAEAHSWCQYLTRESLEAGESVVVSNTFTTYEEMEPYFRIARECWANIEVVTMRGEYESIHAVPPTVMDLMRSRWQEYPA